MNNKPISILLVDDIAETRESIRKLLAFESDFEVVGSAGNGREGVELARTLRPDIVIMDINMPDMDGLEAAGLITKAVPTTGVIMMSVQDDANYMQRAMLAGARFFLPKPVDMDQLYTTIRSVYQQYEPTRQRIEMMQSQPDLVAGAARKPAGERGGHIIVVYSPQGGAGCTTIAVNIAAGLMKERVKVLLVDADLEFGDVGAFLALNSASTIAELASAADDLDTDFFDSVVMTHDSGLKVLLAPPRPDRAAEIRENYPDAITSIISQVAGTYDFVVVDAGKALDTVAVSLLDLASRIVLVTNPTLPAVKNAKLALDVFDQLGYPPEKTLLVLNKVSEDRGARKAMLAPERIQQHLRRPIEGLIGMGDDQLVLSAINKGVPLIALERDSSRQPTSGLMKLADRIFRILMGHAENEVEAPENHKTSRWLPFRL